MAVLFITHDLGVIAETCERVAIMYAGRIAEAATVEQLFAAPAHPYTRALLASLPALAPAPQQPLPAIGGQVPAVGQRPEGCAFANRCPWRIEQCEQRPPLFAVAAGHDSACFRWREVRDE
jgi:peptide/nickel transport system ATP-binding protein